MDDNGTREIEEAVQRALAASGIEGKVTLTGRTLTLRAGGAPVEIDALYLVEQWPLLPDDLRERKAADVAARLSDAEKAARSGAPAPSAPPAARYVPSVRPTGRPAEGPPKPVVVPVGVLLGVLAAAGLGWFWWKGRGPAEESGKPVASAVPETEDQRRERVCEVARKRVLDSGTLTQLDPEVWLAELWLATSKPWDEAARSKGLGELVAGGKLTAAADPDLAAVREGAVEVVSDEAAGRGGLAWHGMHVRFRGGYVSAFFDAAGRERMNRVASRLADATGAEMGALYGRCGHLRYHDIGAWYRGSTWVLASTSLVYSMGFFSERRTTNRDPSAPPTGADIAPLTAAMAKLDKGWLEQSVRETGGTVAPGVGDAPWVITFPLGGPTRAARASSVLAGSAGMGADSPRPAASP